MQHAAIYISVCLAQTGLAIAIFYSGDFLVGLLTKHAKNAWSTEKILTVFAGSMLAVFSVKLLYEYIQKLRGEGETSEEAGAQTVADEEAPREVALVSGEQQGEPRKKWDLFTTAFLGSLDDLTLFVPMLAGNGCDVAQLLIGGVIAASAIVLICALIGSNKRVANLLSRIPVAAIVVVFAVTLLVKGALMQ